MESKNVWRNFRTLSTPRTIFPALTRSYDGAPVKVASTASTSLSLSPRRWAVSVFSREAMISGVSMGIPSISARGATSSVVRRDLGAIGFRQQ